MKKNFNLFWLILFCISGLNADVSAKALSLDFSSAIPLRGHVYRDNQFAVSLTGSAIKGVYESNFDTGSWTTSLPYGCLDKTKITVLKRNVRDCWGNLADLVKGQLILTSSDGNTKYSVDNYEFYAMKNSNGTDMPDDRTAKWSSSIVGAFPSDNSLPMAIAKKYSTNGIALGIISEAASDNIGADWSTFKSYLKIGNDQNLNSNLNWRNNANFHCPAGFKATLQFPSVNGTTVPDLVCSDLLATCDTGAPDLSMRLKSDDPQRRAPYQQFFDPNLSPNWYGPSKAQGAKPGVTVKFDFTGSSGKTDSWKFTTANSGYVPNTCIIGDWSAGVPWSVTDQTPINRINMGNSIYFYCPVFYWDVTNNRVGIYTKNSNSLLHSSAIRHTRRSDSTHGSSVHRAD